MSMFSFPIEMNMSEMMKPINPMADWKQKTEDPRGLAADV